MPNETDSLADELILDLDCPESTIMQSVLQDQQQTCIPPQDRVSWTEPKTKIVTTEYLQKCIGFRTITTVLNNIDTLEQNNIIVRDTGNHPFHSRGETATLPKKKTNNTAVPISSIFGQRWHFDIIFDNSKF